MDQPKLQRYHAHVSACRSCRACMDQSLPECARPENPSDGGFAHHPSPWAEQGSNLNAEVVIVGQDFSGREERWTHPNAAAPTNKFLLACMHDAGLNPQSCYFTNAMLCLKPGAMNATVKAVWLKNCAPHLHKTIEIISPRAVATLGTQACRSVLLAFGKRCTSMLPKGPVPVELDTAAHLFVFGHPGRLGQRARAKAQQQEDWRALALWLASTPDLRKAA